LPPTKAPLRASAAPPAPPAPRLARRLACRAPRAPWPWLGALLRARAARAGNFRARPAAQRARLVSLVGSQVRPARRSAHSAPVGRRQRYQAPRRATPMQILSKQHK
jgi:hypothetical protein